MNEEYLDQMLKAIGIWLVHLGRVSLLVLIGISCLALIFRLLLVKLYAPEWQLALPPIFSKLKLNLLLIALFIGLTLSIFFAIKPDIKFYSYLASQAFADRDYEMAARNYETISNWSADSLDVFENLGICYLNLRRYREAIKAFHQAQAIAPNYEDSYILCAQAHEQVGEFNIAELHLKKALLITQSPQTQAEIKSQLESLRYNHAQIAQ